jgi:ribonuclease HII
MKKISKKSNNSITYELFQNDLKYSEKFSIKSIAGIDEAGRGPWAGPVVAAAVILPLDQKTAEELEGLNDSKKISQKKREYLFDKIKNLAQSVGVAIVEIDEIDKFGIGSATRFAHYRALEMLNPFPELVLIDGREGIDLPILQESIIRGDGKSLAIAAASVIAKVTRDRILVEMHKQYPDYGFLWHKGYGTKVHNQALNLFGPSPVHRKSFAPVRDCLPADSLSPEFKKYWEILNNGKPENLKIFSLNILSDLEREVLEERIKAISRLSP